MRKTSKKKETEFDKLARLIKNESDDIRTHMATKDDIAAIRKEMATKGDVAAIRREMATKEDIAGVMSELRDIKARLKEVEEAVGEHSKYSKEIDHAFERIAAIEKHIGTSKR